MYAADTVFIRLALTADGAFLRELLRVAFREYSERAGEQAPGAGSETWVAVREQRQEGFATVEWTGASGHIAAIAVLERERGRGVGQKLMKAVEVAAWQRGVRELHLATATANVAALELFLRNGFQQTARRERYYGRGQDAVELRKVLDR